MQGNEQLNYLAHALHANSMDHFVRGLLARKVD